MLKGIIYVKALILASILAPALLNGTASAGSISQQIHTTSTVTEKGVIVKVTTNNIGRETAFNVQIIVQFRDIRKTSPIRAKLEPGQYFTALVNLSPKITIPGSYSVEVRINFQDGNGYPFSSLSYGAFVFKEGVNSEIFVQPTDIVMVKKSKIKLEVLNLGHESREINIRLVVPRELNVKPLEKNVKIKARGKKKVTFRLESFSALPGSVFTVLSFLEYEAGGQHFSNVSESKVDVIEGENIFKERRLLFLIFGLLLGALAVLSQIFRPNRGDGEV